MPSLSTPHLSRQGAAAMPPVQKPSQGHLDSGGVTSRKSMRPGGGGRFEAFVSRLVSEGKSASSAKAIAASAGDKKYGKAKMGQMAAAGRKRAGG